MSVEQKNKEFINTYTEAFWNTRDLAAFDTYFADSFVSHHAEGDKNREEFKGLCQAYFSAFPDLHIATEDLVAEGDKGTKVWTARSTHKGEFVGVPASGNKIEVKGIEVFRIDGEKVAELWVSMDALGLMQQIGAIPAMG